jgi:hypothetical protein
MGNQANGGAGGAAGAAGAAGTAGVAGNGKGGGVYNYSANPISLINDILTGHNSASTSDPDVFGSWGTTG